MDRLIFTLTINLLLIISLSLYMLTVPLIAAEKKAIDMGYWLDQAAYFCKANNQVALQDTLYKIVQLVKQSSMATEDKQYVGQLLNNFRQGVCNPLRVDKTTPVLQSSKWNGLWKKINHAQDQYTQLKTRLSYASNINSGSRHRFISVNNFFSGNTDEGISLALDQDNLPQKDSFNEFSIKHQRAINPDWSMYAAYYHQKHKRYKQYDLTVLELGLKEKNNNNNRSSTLYDINTRTTFLNKMHWQNAFMISSVTPLKNTENFALYWNNRVNYNHYIQQKAYDSIDIYSGLNFSYRLSEQGSLHIKTALQHDHALNNRPGKHRNTFSATVGVKYHLPKQWQLKTALQLKQRSDSAAYNQVLFSDNKRQQRLSNFSVSLRKPIGKKTFLNTDYAINQTQDKNIPLFDTEKNQYLGLGLEFNW